MKKSEYNVHFFFVFFLLLDLLVEEAVGYGILCCKLFTTSSGMT